MSQDQTFDSPITGKPAALIGWVETNDINKAKEINRILASFKKTRETLPDTNILAKQANAEGGNEVSENTENAVVEETPAVEETPVVAEDAPAEAPAEDAAADASAETLEKAADVSEVMVDEPD